MGRCARLYVCTCLFTYVYLHVCIHTYVDVHTYKRLLQDYKCLVQCDILSFTCTPLCERVKFSVFLMVVMAGGESSILPTRGSPSDS